MISVAQFIVKTLLEGEEDYPGGGKVIRVRTPQGVVKAHWNGYYDLREIGRGIHHSVGYDDGQGGWSHGMLHPGDEILDPVPSPEEWEAGREAREAAKKVRRAEQGFPTRT
jgi:hypothetical protein